MAENTNEKTFTIEPQKKRFEIIKPGLEGSKKFEILKEDVPKKRFDIISRSDSHFAFARQHNSNDCGPCLILNTLRALQIPTELSSIDDVRNVTNSLREPSRKLSSNGWLSSVDILSLFNVQGAAVSHQWEARDGESRENFFDQMEEHDQYKDPYVAYFQVGRHWSGVWNTQDGHYYLLDSLKSEPLEVQKDLITTLVDRARKNEQAFESIGLVSKNRGA